MRSDFIMLAMISAGLSALAMTGYSALSPGLEIANRTKESLDAGFYAFETAVPEYRKANKTYTWQEDCPPGFDPGSPECVYDRVVDNDGSIDVSTWKDQLVPDYMQLPPYLTEFTWDMGRTLDGQIYACTYSDTKEYTRMAMTSLRRNYTEERLVIGDSCDPGYSYQESDIQSHSGVIYSTFYL